MQTPAPFFLPYLYQGKCKSKQLLIHSYPLMRPAFCGAKSVVSLISACKQRLISHTFFFLFWDGKIKTHVLHPSSCPLLSCHQPNAASLWLWLYLPTSKQIVAISDQGWVISFWYLKTCIISISCYRVVWRDKGSSKPSYGVIFLVKIPQSPL